MEYARAFELPDLQVVWKENQQALLVAARIVGRSSCLDPTDSLILSGLTTHEVLHRFVDDILGGMFPSTPLLRKYREELLLVRRHLHVDALQKAIYVRMGRKPEINAIIASDSMDWGAGYARAWDIVNHHEGHEAFIRELRGK